MPDPIVAFLCVNIEVGLQNWEFVVSLPPITSVPPLTIPEDMIASEVWQFDFPRPSLLFVKPISLLSAIDLRLFFIVDYLPGELF